MKTKSFLFVPAIKKDRFNKALLSGANHIIIDLEDSVSPNQKEEGRANILEFAKSSEYKFFIRTNDAKSEFFSSDIKLLDELYKINKLYGVVLPKTEEFIDYKAFSSYKDLILIPIIETPLGIENLDEICSFNLVKLLSFGALDMSLELNLKEGFGRDFILNYIRSKIVIKSAKHKLLPPINGVYPDIKNEDGLRKDMEFAFSMGYSGALCIHPNQVQIINEVFSPTKEQIAWANDIVELANKTNDIVFNYKGAMIDLPVIKKAYSILENLKNN